jgi:predicted nuclease of predicted toxin-antitoxin system
VKFKLDENLPTELAADLRALGHDAETVLDEGLRGAVDSALVRVATAEGRILLTLDKGIANLLQYPPHEHAGLVLFRPDSSGRRAVLEFMRAFLPRLLEMELQKKVTVAGPSRIRSR